MELGRSGILTFTHLTWVSEWRLLTHFYCTLHGGHFILPLHQGTLQRSPLNTSVAFPRLSQPFPLFFSSCLPLMPLLCPRPPPRVPMGLSAPWLVACILACHLLAAQRDRERVLGVYSNVQLGERVIVNSSVFPTKCLPTLSAWRVVNVCQMAIDFALLGTW